MHLACRAFPLEQDFLQVLSMFAGFGFDWPPFIKAIFNAFSLLNFNFELLAPECSLSVNFETKWCVSLLVVTPSCKLLIGRRRRCAPVCLGGGSCV